MMTKQEKARHYIKKYAMITLGSFIYSLAVILFFDYNDMVNGGVSGAAILLNRFIPIEVGTLMFMLNVPLVLLAIWQFGLKFIVSTFYSVAVMSMFTNLLAAYIKVPATHDTILVALGGGALAAVGIGLVFRAGSTTGGTDIVVRLLKKRHPHMKTSLLFFMVDVVIVTASGFVFQDFEKAMYSALSLLVYSLVADVVLYGRDEAKLIYVITEHPIAIADAFMDQLDCGATYLKGKGAFSKSDKEIVMCVLRKPKYPLAEEIVKELDPEAFLIVTNATEIYGEGYKNLFSEKI
jgi:uncharacterized membrane-anchored protein YitT (DUF2179 family)